MEGFGKKIYIPVVRDKPYGDKVAYNVSKDFRGTVICGMHGKTCPIGKDTLLYLIPPNTKKESQCLLSIWVVQAAHSVLTYLLSNVKGCCL